MSIKLPYGLKDDNLVTIDDVQNGLACECFCPNCKSRLIARKGSDRTHHFSHYEGEDCGVGGESIIHKISKEILASSKEIKLPKLFWSYKPEVIIYEETKIPIDIVRLETRVDDMTPDIIIESQGKLLLVEIKVSHGIDSVKLDKIRKKGISTIEINAVDIISRLFKEGDFFLNSNDIKNNLSIIPWIRNGIIMLIKKRLIDCL